MNANVRLVDASVSRLHARIDWPQGRPRPTILVNGPGIYRFDLEVSAVESPLCLSMRALLEGREAETQRRPKMET